MCGDVVGGGVGCHARDLWGFMCRVCVCVYVCVVMTPIDIHLPPKKPSQAGRRAECRSNPPMARLSICGLSFGVCRLTTARD